MVRKKPVPGAQSILGLLYLAGWTGWKGAKQLGFLVQRSCLDV